MQDDSQSIGNSVCYLVYVHWRFIFSWLNSLELAEEEKTQLKEDLKAARARGYDITHNRLTEGLFAVGFPIYNSANQLVAGLSVGGVYDLERPDAVEKYIQQGRQLAVEINNQMGSNYYSRISDWFVEMQRRMIIWEIRTEEILFCLGFFFCC